jgi:hypothetical protein
MSLLRLLKAGKSLVDNQNNVGRYRVTSQRLLPKFGSKANPFRAAAIESPKAEVQSSDEPLLNAASGETREVPLPLTLSQGEKSLVSDEGDKVHGFSVRSLVAPEGAVAETACSPGAGPKGTQRLPVVMESPTPSITRTEEGGVVTLKSQKDIAVASPFAGGVAAKVSSRDRTIAWFSQVAATLRKSPPLLFVLCANWGSAAWTGLVCFAKAVRSKVKGWWKAALSKAGSVMKRKPKVEKPAIPAFPEPAVQGELSLDRVKVMRNDLSDADLEVVPAKPSMAAAVAAMAGKPTTRRAEPALAAALPASKDASGEEWQKVSLEMFGAEKS